MNKEQFTTILEVALLYFEGVSEENIKKLLPPYTDREIQTGIKLSNYLKKRK